MGLEILPDTFYASKKSPGWGPELGDHWIAARLQQAGAKALIARFALGLRTGAACSSGSRRRERFTLTGLFGGRGHFFGRRAEAGRFAGTVGSRWREGLTLAGLFGGCGHFFGRLAKAAVRGIATH